MESISLDVYSINDDEKPKEQYMTIIVFCKKYDFSDTGFYDGCSFKLWGRSAKIKHKDITHWAYMPKLQCS